MVKPRKLSAGDRIGIVAPASPFVRDEFDKGVAELRQLGFEPVFQESVFGTHRGYLAGAAEARARAFLEAWTDPSIAALIAVRGGYGSVHLLPHLAQHDLRRTPKAFVGYSDLTSVLTYLTNLCGIVSFHGPMLDRRLGRGIDAYDRATFLKALTTVEPLGELSAAGLEVFRTGEASGVLTGGTLAQLAASVGTPYAFAPPEGCILFLEDVSERPYRLDRMVTQLLLSGVLEKAAAVVLGEFPDCDEPRGEPSARAVLFELFKEFNGPVVYGFPSGHTNMPLQTLPFGVRATVIAREQARLVIEEAGVA